MTREELQKEMTMTYYDLVEYLLEKYGGATCDYFATPECKSRSKKISRTKEGLFCHHIDEDKGGSLSDPYAAKSQPFAWQKKERLVYCNILEHLLLHLKIDILRQQDKFRKPSDIYKFFTTGGVFVVGEEICDMILNLEELPVWKKRCYEEVTNIFDDYVWILKILFKYIDNNYIAKKDGSSFLKIGASFPLGGRDMVIVDFDEGRSWIEVSIEGKENKKIYLSAALFETSQLTYCDYIDICLRWATRGNSIIYRSVMETNQGELIEEYARKLNVDYHENPFAKFADIELSSDYGVNNAGEYIAKALPMFADEDKELPLGVPMFWKGNSLPEVARKGFFVVRIKTMFSIKKGQKAFVRFRGSDWVRDINICKISEGKNFLTRGYTVMETSDIYDKKTKQYYSRYSDRTGKVYDAFMVLSLGKDDFELFKERYEIRSMEILDGCYWET